MKNDSLINKIYAKKTINRFEKKLKYLGSSYDYNVGTVLKTQTMITIIIFVLALFVFKNEIYVAFIIVPLVYMSFEYFFLDYRINKRKNLLNKQALFYFQILSLTLESGNNLTNAIALTSSSLDNELSLEFKKVIDDIKMGSSLNESLNDLKTRIPSDIIDNIILNLMESNIYGSNMIESLNTQLLYLNDKLLLSVRERINKMPIKISIISVLVFIPLILLIILSPLFIQIVNSWQ